MNVGSARLRHDVGRFGGVMGLRGGDVQIGFGDARRALAGDEQGDFEADLFLAFAGEECLLAVRFLVLEAELRIWISASRAAIRMRGGDRFALGANLGIAVTKQLHHIGKCQRL